MALESDMCFVFLKSHEKTHTHRNAEGALFDSWDDLQYNYSPKKIIKDNQGNEEKKQKPSYVFLLSLS